MRGPAIALVLALLLVTATHAEDRQLRIIQLRHRPAVELLPLIQPLLRPGDVVTGTDFRLIARASEANLREIERLLRQLDVAQRDLTLTVRQAVFANQADTDHAVSGDVAVGGSGRIIVRKPQPSDNGGLTIGSNGPGHTLKYHARQSATQSHDQVTQSLRVRDGSSAYIRIGQSIPTGPEPVSLPGGGPLVTLTGNYQDATTGFEVRPRLRGAQVLLEITPRGASVRDATRGALQIQELATTVTEQLGERVDIGQILGAAGEMNRKILAYATASTGERRVILLRVD